MRLTLFGIMFILNLILCLLLHSLKVPGFPADIIEWITSILTGACGAFLFIDYRKANGDD